MVVSTKLHVLALCEHGRPVFTYDVRIGSGGVGKTKAGDKKTPLGGYDLGRPRRSKTYGWFVPIGYPTAQQARSGFTGDSVGIHGPDRRVRWLGRINNWFDTTDGCVGIARDGEMLAIVKWLGRTRAERIIID